MNVEPMALSEFGTSISTTVKEIPDEKSPTLFKGILGDMRNTADSIRPTSLISLKNTSEVQAAAAEGHLQNETDTSQTRIPTANETCLNNIDSQESPFTQPMTQLSDTLTNIHDALHRIMLATRGRGKQTTPAVPNNPANNTDKTGLAAFGASPLTTMSTAARLVDHSEAQSDESTKTALVPNANELNQNIDNFQWALMNQRLAPKAADSTSATDPQFSESITNTDSQSNDLAAEITGVHAYSTNRKIQRKSDLPFSVPDHNIQSTGEKANTLYAVLTKSDLSGQSSVSEIDFSAPPQVSGYAVENETANRALRDQFNISNKAPSIDQPIIHVNQSSKDALSSNRRDTDKDMQDYSDESGKDSTNHIVAINENLILPTTTPTSDFDMHFASDIADTGKFTITRESWQILNKQLLNALSAIDQSTTLDLNLPEIGPLKIEIKVNQQATEATFISNDPGIRQAIEMGLPQLRLLLQKSGIDLKQTRITEGTLPTMQNNSRELKLSTRLINSESLPVKSLSNESIKLTRVRSNRDSSSLFN